MVTRQRGTRGHLDALEVAFDDQRVVADAGLILPATLCDRLGAKGLIDRLVKRPTNSAVGAGAGAKALSVVLAMLAGADSIDGIDRLRAGAAGAVLGGSPGGGHHHRQLAARPGLRPGAPARRGGR